jgi:hypothetical protein
VRGRAQGRNLGGPSLPLKPCLKVARAARGQATRILNLILLHQPPPQRLLITWGLPLHIKDVLARPDEFFGMAMTRETPLHR